MSVLQSVLTLYIKPASGPTEAVDLDMLQIENEIVRMPVSLDRDKERVNAIIAKIRAAFPKVQPEARQDELRTLISKITDVALFDGVVLKLPGSIDGTPTAKNPILEQFDQLSAESLKVKGELQLLTNKFKILENEKKSLVVENIDLLEREKLARDLLLPLQQKAQEMGDEAFKAQVEAHQNKVQLEACQQQQATLQAQYNKVNQELQIAQHDLQEVVRLRQMVASFKTTEQQLKDEVSRRDQEVTTLRQGIADLQRLVQSLENQAAAPRPQNKDEGRDLKKNPYLDQ